MRLTLIRHAPAQALRPGALDRSRPLTARGERAWRRQVRGLCRSGWTSAEIWTSPWLRARQTARWVERATAAKSRTVLALARAPQTDLLELLDEREEVTLVGHEPWLCALEAWLVSGRTQAHGLPFEKGEVRVLEGRSRPGGMRRIQRFEPRLLALLGRG